MALQGSGSISMSQINSELQRSSTSTISLDAAENGSYATINTCSSSRPSSGNPASMSEWYSYNHTASCGGPLCTIWYAPYSGFFSFINCNGVFDNQYFEMNQSVCARSTNGMINSGTDCSNSGSQFT
jgi:hypothetical protein